MNPPILEFPDKMKMTSSSSTVAIAVGQSEKGLKNSFNPVQNPDQSRIQSRIESRSYHFPIYTGFFRSVVTKKKSDENPRMRVIPHPRKCAHAPILVAFL